MNNNFEVELSKGLFAGQKLVPIETVGCYVPGGRYPHISSAIMSIVPAKVAGVKNIICASPPKDIHGANNGIIFAANYCGANLIMNLGGVSAIGSLTYGCFETSQLIFWLVLEINMLLRRKELFLEKSVSINLQDQLK